MASTTVNIPSIGERVATAIQKVTAELKQVDDMDDRISFQSDLNRLTWITELAALSADGMLTLDSEDMDAIWNWTPDWNETIGKAA